MKTVIRIPHKSKVPNPAYGEGAARAFEANNKRVNLERKKKGLEELVYSIPKEIEKVDYTIINVDGKPEVVNNISAYIFKNYKEAE